MARGWKATARSRCRKTTSQSTAPRSREWQAPSATTGFPGTTRSAPPSRRSAALRRTWGSGSGTDEDDAMSIKREDLDAGRVDFSGVVTGKRLPLVHPGEILRDDFL